MVLQPELDHELLDALGLDVQKITSHHKKIQQVLNGECSTTLQVVDVCTVENGCIIGWTQVQKICQHTNNIKIFQNNSIDDDSKWLLKSVVTCIPAAGAGSRYWHGASKELIQNKKNLPKAFLQATEENDTFLEIKMLEHEALFPTQANVFIASLGLKQQFLEHIKAAAHRLKLKFEQYEYLVLEQHQNLSTIRFKLTGEPYKDQKNQYSKVPAGHGELLHLFDDITKHFVDARAIHLRNVDNIIGTQPERREELTTLAKTYALIQSAVDVLRKDVDDLLQNQTDKTQLCFKNAKFNSAVRFLKELCPNLLLDLFMDDDCEKDWYKIQKHLNKPLSVFGVVKKEADDQGGGPVFAKLPNGKTTQICLEMSHASEKDKEEYFGSNGKLSYFNPVLVFFEMKKADGSCTNFTDLFDENFWLLSKRKFENEDVCYHETVLYELIGNSEKTNLVFVEVPRSLFRPHKYFKDSEGKTRKSYGIAK